MDEIKDFIKMMDCMKDVLEITDSTNKEDIVALKVVSKIIDTKLYKALKDLVNQEVDSQNTRYDKAYCLEVELNELVQAVFKAKDLDRLKETTKRNFPVEWEYYEGFGKKKEQDDDCYYCGETMYRDSSGVFMHVCADKELDDGWIAWSGGEQPVDDDDVEVEVRLSNGRIDKGDAWTWEWAHDDDTDDNNIIAYRIVKEPEKEQTFRKYYATQMGVESIPTLVNLISTYLEEKD